MSVSDAARLTVPDDPAYAFVGAQVGEPVWVVPQTQNPDVVWVGWNTQDPQVMEAIDRGITLALTGTQGPGVVTTYLQSGSFGEPQVLFDSRIPGAQPVWVDVNTHTHANWVFTAPGVYLLRLEASAELVDGTTVSDTALMRFAVGGATSPQEALAAVWVQDGAESGAANEAGAAPADGARSVAEGGDGSQSAGAASVADGAASAQDGAGGEASTVDGGTGLAPEGEEGDGEESDRLVPILIGLIALVAVGLAVGFAIAIGRGNRMKRRIVASRVGGGEGE
jgi:surface-anchored protein